MGGSCCWRSPSDVHECKGMLQLSDTSSTETDCMWQLQTMFQADTWTNRRGAHSTSLPATCAPNLNTAVQVVALQLGKGHKAAALCTARLPSSSVSALHRLPGQPAPEKEFIIVASYLEAAWGTSPGLGRPQGLLSIFEVCPASSASSAAGR